MGSWNKTCGLSNLHINYGDPVYVFVLEQQQYHGRCYTTAFWKPTLLPFQSTYNDYGGGENSHGIGLNLIINSIRTKLIERELGTNQYHDIAVKKESFDVELLFNAIKENRLSIKNSSGKEVELDYVMMRQDIVDDILYHWDQTVYVGDGKGDRGEDNAYIMYNFDSVLNDIPEMIERIKARWDMTITSCRENQNELPDLCTLTTNDFLLFGGLSSCFEWDDPNKAWKYLKFTNDTTGISQIVNLQDTILHMIVSGQVDKATSLITDCIKGAYIDSFMDATRRCWMPQSHEGSQRQSHEEYLLLNDAIRKALEIENNDYEEEED